jgi:SAM-dependent methyltransferase
MSSYRDFDEAEAAEARAFDRRIEERARAGFIPDLRRAVKCEYFYKSFWRDPHYIQLFLGRRAELYLNLLRKYGGEGLNILDVGCGAGYFSLELARAGHHVVAIDISESSVNEARKTLAANPFTEGFGSLEYHVMPFRQAGGQYDVVLFSASMHHFDNAEQVVTKASELLSPEGLILCAEPWHEKWQMEDAAQVALMRVLLSLTGFWYEPGLGDEILGGHEKLASYIEDVRIEYVTEQDKHEQGQSPHDNDLTGEEIFAALAKYFKPLECRPATAFIYRLLGGLRGPDEITHKIADFLTMYDELAVSKGYMRPSGQIFVGKKMT